MNNYNPYNQPQGYNSQSTNPYGQQRNTYSNQAQGGTGINNYSNQAQGAIGVMGQMSRARQGQYGADYDRDMETINNNPGYQKSGDLYDSSRASFVRKVYTILSIQLIITAAVCAWAMKTQSFKTMFVNTPAIIIISVLLMALSIVVGCCGETMRKYGLPILIGFTILFSLLVGIICAGTKPEIVLMATAITAVVVVALTIYACVTKTDLTGCGPYLFVFMLVLIVFGIVCIFWRNPIVHLVYACLAALLYSVYLIFDTQLVLGKFTHAYSLDDAYLAAIQLYIDIIQIFLQVLRILSYVNN